VSQSVAVSAADRSARALLSSAIMGVRDRLHDVYARVPVLRCRGLCQDTCGPIPATHHEVRFMERRSHRRYGWQLKSGHCTFLDESTGRCTCYQERPLVCRAWGTLASSACPFGCEPDRWLTQEAFQGLVARVNDIAGPSIAPQPFSGDHLATSDEVQAASCAADALIARGLRLPDRWDTSQPYVICPACQWRGQHDEGFSADTFVGDRCPQCSADELRLARKGDRPLFVPLSR
jgi:hypothetical protein